MSKEENRKRNKTVLVVAAMLAAALCGCSGVGGQTSSVSKDASSAMTVISKAAMVESDIVLTDEQEKSSYTALEALGRLAPEERTEERIRIELAAMEANGMIDAGSVRFYKNPGLFMFSVNDVPCAFMMNGEEGSAATDAADSSAKDSKNDESVAETANADGASTEVQDAEGVESL